VICLITLITTIRGIIPTTMIHIGMAAMIQAALTTAAMTVAEAVSTARAVLILAVPAAIVAVAVVAAESETAYQIGKEVPHGSAERDGRLFV
jgi:hypothetical protein